MSDKWCEYEGRTQCITWWRGSCLAGLVHGGEIPSEEFTVVTILLMPNNCDDAFGYAPIKISKLLLDKPRQEQTRQNQTRQSRNRQGNGKNRQGKNRQGKNRQGKQGKGEGDE